MIFTVTLMHSIEMRVFNSCLSLTKKEQESWSGRECNCVCGRLDRLQRNSIFSMDGWDVVFDFMIVVNMGNLA